MLLVETKELVRLVKNAGKVAPRRGKPILSCARITFDGEQLAVEATDLGVGSRATTCRADGQIDETVVNASQLLASLKTAKCDNLALSRDNGSLVIDAAGAKSTIYVLDPADFPPVASNATASPNLHHVLTISADTLRRILPAALSAVAKENTRYAINGVYLVAGNPEHSSNLVDGQPRLVATDGRRMVAIDIHAPAARECSSILPIRGLEAVLVNLGKRGRRQPDTAVDIAMSENGRQFVFADAELGWSVSMVAVDGQFPRWPDVYPSPSSMTDWTINPAEFAAAVKSVAVQTNEESKGIRLEFADGYCNLYGRAPSQGEATATIPVNGNGKLTIGLNPHFLLDAIAGAPADAAGLIQFSGKEPNRPVMLGADTDARWVIMPVSLT